MATATATRLQSETTTSNPFKTFLAKYFYFVMSVVFAGLIIAGFSRTVDHNLLHATPPRPLLLWFHGAAFSAWVLFFIAQSALVRVRSVSIHRTIGWFGAALGASMVVLGIAVSIVMTRFDVSILKQKGAEAFLSVPLLDMIVFGTCVSLAIYWRKKPELHRRLLFIATCHLLDAGVGRFDVIFNNNLFYPILDLLIVAGMLRDRLVDGRINAIYWKVLPVLVILQAFATYLWRVNPYWWQGVTSAILW